MRGPNRPPSVHHRQRPVTVSDAAPQLPLTRGNTGGLSRPINPDNQPLGRRPKKPGYGASPAITPLDSKIGYRGQEVAAYDGKRHERPNESKAHEAKESPALERREQRTGRELSPGYDADKVGKVMHEYKHGTLHSGSKHGRKVTSRQQAIAIGLSEQRKKEGK